MDTEKVTSKINEVDSKVEDRFSKHELQMQLIVENNADDSTKTG